MDIKVKPPPVHFTPNLFLSVFVTFSNLISLEGNVHAYRPLTNGPSHNSGLREFVMKEC